MVGEDVEVRDEEGFKCGQRKILQNLCTVPEFRPVINSRLSKPQVP